MSRKIKITDLNDKELEKLSSDLTVSQAPSKYAFSASPNYITLYDIEKDYIYIPFSYNNNYDRPDRTKFINCPDMIFNGNLRDNQKEVKNESIERLNTYGSVIIAAACGFGKTSTSIYIACKIKLKTLILCHRIVLINQWESSIKKFSPTSRICILAGNFKTFPDSDFYIMNAANVCKYPRNFYKKIGCLIVDEAHIIMAEKLSQSMRYIVPRYVIGLSATPYRTDGLDSLIDMYFGKYKIVRKLFRKHTVYKYETEFKPETKLNRMGKVDWNSVLESQSLNKERNEIIIKIIKYFSKKVFLVLCKRVDQAKYILQRLQEEKEDVTSLIGSNQEFLQSSRILVGTVQKTGVGFDHPRLNSLIIASDVEQYFVQYLGRVFRNEDDEPIIFDLVDNFSILHKHFKTRYSVYIEHGGIVKNFKKEFPDFHNINK